MPSAHTGPDKDRKKARSIPIRELLASLAGGSIAYRPTLWARAKK